MYRTCCFPVKNFDYSGLEWRQRLVGNDWHFGRLEIDRAVLDIRKV